MAVAVSSDVPVRPKGMVLTKLANISGVENISWKGVSMTPGETAFTRTLCGASSFAQAFVRVIRPPLAVEYAPAPGPPPFLPAMETILTMLPDLRSIMEGATACEQSRTL